MSIEILTQKIEEVKAILLQQNEIQKDVLTVEEACKFLSISESYLYKLTSGNKISYFKPEGKKIYFQRADLESWILRNKVKSNDELEDEIYKDAKTNKYTYKGFKK